MTKYWMLIGSEAYNYSLIVLFIINVLPKQTKWRQAKRRLAAKDRNLHPVAILNSTARTTRWTGTASEKKAQFLRAKFEK